ncbi:HAD-IA family hydrolase [Spirosoma sp. HMF4905]|uniref:HAD-IA family hydrolase n=1 Tax=Spirosoma arboris TaxID=2682092 RepID=A0A7K1SND9_9BACT|nr:HAD-IA family hydrolase [Spirosoma arboris]MVM35193.1 HAD-IA family hydrolase [Spirosoma arboris]
MENKIKMVVFDMAGTTVDENNVVYKTVQKAINQFGFDVTLDQVLEQGAGKEKLQAIKSVLSTYVDNTDAELAETIYQVFIGELAEAYSTLEILPQPNAVEVFSALMERNILTVLNTGYNRETAETILTKLGWEEGREFDALVTATDVAKNRPNPDMIVYAMDDFSIENGESVIKVGDSIIDIEEGRNAGCIACIGITTGAHTREQLETTSPDYIIDNLIELVSIIDAYSTENA